MTKKIIITYYEPEELIKYYTGDDTHKEAFMWSTNIKNAKIFPSRVDAHEVRVTLSSLPLSGKPENVRLEDFGVTMNEDTKSMLEAMRGSTNQNCREIACRVLDKKSTVEDEIKYTGDFMTAVLQGEFIEAFNRADHENKPLFVKLLMPAVPVFTPKVRIDEGCPMCGSSRAGLNGDTWICMSCGWRWPDSDQ